jgi:uncharacterized protein YkwD
LTIVALLLAAATASTPAPTPAPTPVPCAGTSASLAQEFLGHINAARRRRDLAPLRLSEPLCRAARRRAEEIGRASASSFEALEGDDLLALVAKDGYEARYVGELIVQAEGTPRGIAAGWKRDLGEAEAFGTPEAREAGIGVARREDTPLYVFLFAQGAFEEFRDRTSGLAEREAVLARMLEDVNARRRAHLKSSGRPPAALDLRRNSLLDRAAQAHADDMLARSFYGHESPEGRDAFYRARVAGYRGWMVGENIAQGQSTLREVMEGWMDSPEHRKNILNLEYTEAGFGLAVGRNAQGYQVLWVQVFGKPR